MWLFALVTYDRLHVTQDSYIFYCFFFSLVIAASFRSRQEIQCLLYAGFLFLMNTKEVQIMFLRVIIKLISLPIQDLALAWNLDDLLADAKALQAKSLSNKSQNLKVNVTHHFLLWHRKGLFINPFLANPSPPLWRITSVVNSPECIGYKPVFSVELQTFLTYFYIELKFCPGELMAAPRIAKESSPYQK